MAAVPERAWGFELSRPGLELLALCDGSRDVAALARALDWPGPSPAAREVVVRATLTRLAEAGLLMDGAPTRDPEAEDGEEDPYFAAYAHPAVHREFVGDPVRTGAYQRAIAAVVRPGDVVVDVGAGTGLLSVLAARAGARVVHAVEPTAIARVIPAVAAANGVGDRVVVHRADAATLDLDARADVLIADWVGSLVVTERVFPAAARLRDRCLASGGRVVPDEVVLHAAPACDPGARATGPELWSTRPAGVDLAPVGALEYRRPRTARRTVLPAALLAPAAALHTFPCRTMTPSAARAFRAAPASFVVERDAVLDGLCVYFVSRLAPGVDLDTSPGAPGTFYRQHWLPLAPRPVAAGERVTFTLAVEEDPAGAQEVTLVVERADERSEQRYAPG